MKKNIKNKIKKRFVLGQTKINTDKSYFYYHALATEKSMIERVKKLLANHNVVLFKHKKPHEWPGIRTMAPYANLLSNTWVAETEEPLDVRGLMDIAVLPTSPLILKAVLLRDQLVHIAYGSEYWTLDKNEPPNIIIEMLTQVPSQDILLFNLNPLVVIYKKDVDTRNE